MSMRVAYLSHYAELYGANRSMLDLIRELRKRGVVEPVVVVAREGPLVRLLEEEDIPCLVAPFEPWMGQRRYSGRLHHRLRQHWDHERAARARREANHRVLPSIVRWLQEQRIDAVHANSSVVGIAPALKEALHRPLIWHIRELPERQYLLHLDAGRRGYGRALRTADRLIAISEAVRADILSYTGPRAKPVMIYNGVLPQARYAECRRTNDERWTSPAPFTFAMLGLIHPSKGQEEAVRALAIVRRSRPDARMVIAGDGKDAAMLRTIQELGLADAIDVRGFVPDVWPILRGSHALLMCSRNEAMGRVTVEAMAAGLPVIGHASGGTLELVQDGVNGLLYPGGADALAERMLLLLSDPALARRLGDDASRIAEQRFSIERYAGEVAEVYRSVLSASTQP